MKKSVLLFFMIILMIGFLFHPACKTEETCEFSILGTWSVSITFILQDYTFVENLTFTGIETSGTVIGWQYEPGQTGTFTVTNCNSVQFVFNYVSLEYGNTNIVFNGTLHSNNNMSGTGTWYDDDFGEIYDLSWTAVKF